MIAFSAAGSCFAALAFVALVAYAHIKRSELDRTATPLSSYFSHPTRGVMLAAYFCLSVALVCVAVTIIPEQQGAIVSGVNVVSGVLILVAAACLIPIGLTAPRMLDADVRSARTRSLHRILVLVAFVAMVSSTTMYSMLGLPTLYRYQRTIRMVDILVSMLAAAMFVLLTQLPPGSRYYRLFQKFIVALMVVWIVVSAWV